jgi:hypothetical protein
MICVRPFFAPLTALKKELGDELRKKDTEIPLSVHWGYIYINLECTFKGFFSDCAVFLRFQWAQAPIVNYPGF